MRAWRTYLFDGAARLLPPLLTAQFHRAVHVHFFVIGAKEEEPEVKDNQTTAISLYLLGLATS